MIFNLRRKYGDTLYIASVTRWQVGPLSMYRGSRGELETEARLRL